MLAQESAIAFFSDVLRRIDVPVTDANLAWFLKWQSFEQSPEGPDAEWNPLNTTRDWDEYGVHVVTIAPDFNSVGVKRFARREAGIIATAATLMNGLYPAILLALKTSHFTPSFELAADLARWGTTGFAAFVRDTEWRPLTADDINAALQKRFFLARLAWIPDLPTVERAISLLESAGIFV